MDGTCQGCFSGEGRIKRSKRQEGRADHVMRQRIRGVRGEPLLGAAGDPELLEMGTVPAIPGPFACLVSWPAALCLIPETKKHRGGKKDFSAERPPKQSLTPTSRAAAGGHRHSSLPQP